MSQWHNPSYPTQPTEFNDITQLRTLDANLCFDFPSASPALEFVSHDSQFPTLDQTPSLVHNQPHSTGNSIQGSLPNSFPSSDGIALYDQAPSTLFAVGVEEGFSDLRFDKLQEPGNQGRQSSTELNDYLDLSNSGRVEEDQTRPRHLSSMSAVRGEDSRLPGRTIRQNALVSDHSVQPSLPRRRSRYLLQRSGNKSIPIPALKSTVHSWTAADSRDPMQRWQDSPPEDEPAPMAAIYNALKDRSLDFPGHNAALQENRMPNRGAGNLNSFREHRQAPSVTSFDSAASNSSKHSGNSSRSAASAASQGPYSSLSRTAGGRVRPNRRNDGDKRRIFQCTFCCDSFKHRYDWARHEKSLHLNMEEWRCAPYGSSAVSALTGRVHCAYCNALDPTTEHLDTHNHLACQGDMAQSRIFRRKDHLVQHLRHMHQLDTLPLIDDWKLETPPIVSRCGFCNITMASWEERVSHLAAHFRKGSTMSSWRGDHGFEPSVASRVTNALPPYLIGAESLSIIPFSATSSGSKDHFNQISSQIGWPVNGPAPAGVEAVAETPSDRIHFGQLPSNTKAFTEILTQHLSRYAQQQIVLGIFLPMRCFSKSQDECCMIVKTPGTRLLPTIRNGWLPFDVSMVWISCLMSERPVYNS